MLVVQSLVDDYGGESSDDRDYDPNEPDEDEEVIRSRQGAARACLFGVDQGPASDGETARRVVDQTRNLNRLMCQDEPETRIDKMDDGDEEEDEEDDSDIVGPCPPLFPPTLFPHTSTEARVQPDPSLAGSEDEVQERARLRKMTSPRRVITKPAELRRTNPELSQVVALGCVLIPGSLTIVRCQEVRFEGFEEKCLAGAGKVIHSLDTGTRVCGASD